MVLMIWDANMEIKLEVLKCFFERDFCMFIKILNYNIYD